MEDCDRNTIHGTAELSSGDRVDLFQSNVRDKLVNIVCGGCGLSFEDHYSWEEHIRDMVELEDTDHNFFTQVMDGGQGNAVLDGEYECPDCGNRYRTEEERDNHRLTIATSVRLVCSQCANLVPDMELHLPLHQDKEKCGECGEVYTDIKNHMYGVHGGFMSVLILQTVRCAGDGSTLVSLEIVLATDARFLASEVKPAEPDTNRKVTPPAKKRKQEAMDKQSNGHSNGQSKGPPTKRVVYDYQLKDEFSTGEEDEEETEKKVKTAGNGKKSWISQLTDEDLHLHQVSLDRSAYEVIKTEEIKPKPPPTVKKKASPVKTPKQVEVIKEVLDLSERDRALCPPPTLPPDFFDAQGVRVWAKLSTRKGVHQCELCGFNAKTKNKYREKQDHLMKWHFSQRIDEILPATGKKPFYCPLCEYSGKDRQCVVRHYTGKHQALDIWMGEFLDAVTCNNMTLALLNTVENVDIIPKPTDVQKPWRGKIVNTQADMERLVQSFVPVEEEYVADEQKQLQHHQCELCDAVFTSNSSLKTHKLAEHKGLKEERKQAKLKEAKVILASRQEEAAPSSRRSSSRVKPEAKTEAEEESTAVAPERKGLQLRKDLMESKPSLPPPPAKPNAASPVKAKSPRELASRGADFKILSLEDEGSAGLRCLTCPRTKTGYFKSIIELKEHIQMNHMDLCRLQFFVNCHSRSAGSISKAFNYILCTQCGVCLSQNSEDSTLVGHAAKHNNPAQLEEEEWEEEEYEEFIEEEIEDTEDMTRVSIQNGNISKGKKQAVAQVRDEFMDC